MLTVSIGLLLFLLPIESYRKAGCSQQSRCTSRIGGDIRWQITDYNRGCCGTELYDKEDSAGDGSTYLEEIQRLRLQEESKLSYADRTDETKAKNLLTKDWELPNAIEDIRCYLSVNESFVPVIGVHKRETFIKLRSYLFGQGVYPGVEYKILNIAILSNNSANSAKREVKTLQGMLQRGRKDSGPNSGSSGWISRVFSGQSQLIQTSGSDSSVIINTNENAAASLDSYIEEEDFIELTVRPAYPLIKNLEKKWPVKIRLSAVPYVFSRAMYTTVTLLGTLSFALSYFLGALLLTQVFTLSFVNSRSMTPTILPGDLILVEKISPIIRRALFHIPPASEGDVVFFSAPPRLLEYIEESNTLIKKPTVEQVKSTSSPSSSSKKTVIANTGAMDSDKSDSSPSPSTSSSASSFNDNFLAAQDTLTVPGGTESVVAVAPAVVPRDRNPFHYRNLRPIGGNTLLVKRLTSVTYPETEAQSVSASSGVSGTKKISSSSVVEGTMVAASTEGEKKSKGTSLLKVRGIKEEKKGPACLFVRGDNPDVSLDSRQWGCLDEELVVGRPLFTVLPIKRFGLIR